MMDGLNRTAKEYDMKVNIKKTKVIKVSRKGEDEIDITIDEERLEQVDRFRYLGALIMSDGRCETELKTRIGMAKNAFNQRKELLRKSLNKDIKKRIIKAIIWKEMSYYGIKEKGGKYERIKKIEAKKL